MTRVAVSIHPTDPDDVPASTPLLPDHVPGLYVAELPDGQAIDQWARLERLESYMTPDPNDGVFALTALLSPEGEVTIFNADLGAGGYLGSPAIICDVTVAQAGEKNSFSAWLPDACGLIAREGVELLDSWSRTYAVAVVAGGPIDFVPTADPGLFPESDYPVTSSAGSARMAAHYSGAIRRLVLVGAYPEDALIHLSNNLLRPVHGFFTSPDHGPTPFLGATHPKSTPHGGYSNKGGWGSLLYGSTEHFGRPAGVLSVSPWEPDDHLHFAGHQWAAYALLTGSSAAAFHVVAMIESLWVQIRDGVWDAARAYGPLPGTIGEVLLLAQERAERGETWWGSYRDYLLKVLLPAFFAKLESENLTATTRDALYGEPEAWQANVLDRGKADHLKDAQTVWMTGQLVIGMQKLMHWIRHVADVTKDATLLPLYKRARNQWLLGTMILVRHGWGDPNGRGWCEDVSPYAGRKQGSSKNAITGKYRQYILSALMVARAQLLRDAAEAKAESQRIAWEALAEEAWIKAQWLARQLVGSKPGDGWFGSSQAADKGWGTFLLDEGWLMAGALGEVTPDGWRKVLPAFEAAP